MKNGKDEKPKPRRFYSEVSLGEVSGGWRILLDGRSVKTPQRAELILSSRALAEAIAEEWRAQSGELRLQDMRLTRLANTAIDAVSLNADAVAEDILAYARRDLICYRAEGPDRLVARQKELWDPLLAWAGERYGAQLSATTGIMPIDQPSESLAALRAAFTGYDAFGLTALHMITTLMGSAVLALAHVSGRLSLDESWTAAHVDEDYQIEAWGEDTEAAARRKARLAEMRAASDFFRFSQAPQASSALPSRSQ
jgi:chaperone required for assembly of F1-ATPase